MDGSTLLAHALKDQGAECIFTVVGGPAVVSSNLAGSDLVMIGGIVNTFAFQIVTVKSITSYQQLRLIERSRYRHIVNRIFEARSKLCIESSHCQDAGEAASLEHG